MNDRLKQTRIARTLKQWDMARLLQIDQRTYSRYERGEIEPTFDVKVRIAAILGATVTDLFASQQEVTQ